VILDLLRLIKPEPISSYDLRMKLRHSQKSFTGNIRILRDTGNVDVHLEDGWSGPHRVYSITPRGLETLTALESLSRTLIV
jgi:DNA-binding PadR family transcriptional regulator